MATASQIASGIAGVIDNITGLRVYSYVPEDIQPPACILAIGEVAPETMARGFVSYPFEATVLVSKASDRVGQSNLYDYVSFTGTNSLWAAFTDNNTIGLSDGTRATVMRYRPLGIEEIAAYGYFGGTFTIQVLTPGA